MTFSVSSIKDFRNCGYKFWLRKVKKQKGINKGHSTWLGSLVHTSLYKAIGVSVEGSGRGEVNPTGNFEPEKSRNYFSAVWNGEIIDPEIGPRPVTFYPKKKLVSLKTLDQKKLVENWRIQAEKMLENGLVFLEGKKIVEIEKEIRIRLMGHDFLGYIDLVAEEPDGSLKFYDFKTTWDKPSQASISNDLQFAMYSLALGRTLCAIDGQFFYPSGGLVHLRSGSVVDFFFSESVYENMKYELRNDFSRLSNDVFIQELGNPLCRYCDYYEHCYGKPVDLESLLV